MTAAIDLRPDHRKIVEDILRDHLPDGVKVWVFGSRAEWTTKDSSDLDLALESDKPLDTRTVMALELAFEESLLPFRVDVVDLERAEDGFREIVEASRTPWRWGSVGRRDWIRGVLADACQAIDYGLTASASSDPSGPKFLRITDIVSGHIDWSSVPYATVDEATREKYRLYDGDIVIARTGASTGASAFVKAPPDAVFASYLVRLQARKGYDARFLAYFLKSDQFSSFLRGVLGDKSAQPNASASTMTAAPLLAPRSWAEQHAIGCVLGALDDRIELIRRMNETMEAMARALYKSWFVDFDPVRAKMEGRDPGLPSEIADLFPDRLVDSELGEIPEGWEHKSIYEMANVVYGAPFKSRFFNEDRLGRPLIRIRDLATHEPGVFTEEVHKTGHLVHPGDIVVGMDGEFRLHMWKGESAWLNQRVCSFQPITGTPRSFLAEALKVPLASCERGKTGTTVIHLGKSDIDQFLLPHPGYRLLAAFAEAVEPPLRQTVRNAAQGRSLRQIRDTMLAKLVSGEIRIPAALVSEAA